MESFDVVVVGAGLAGLHFAEAIGGNAGRILIVDRKSSVEERVHTTGIFVRKTVDDFPIDADCLGPWVRRVKLYAPSGRCIDLEAPAGEFRVGRMGLLYRRKLARAIDAGVHWRAHTAFVDAHQTDGGSTVILRTGSREYQVTARILVGADGAVSRVARTLRLDENREWIVGAEELYEQPARANAPALHCFIDPTLAPGYIAWVVDDGEEIHLGVGGYATEFDPVSALAKFRDIARRVVDVSNLRLIERRGGRIPVGGVLSRIGNRRGLLVGDAAGAPSPLTAGGLDACFRLSQHAAGVASRFLSGDHYALASYRGDQFKARFIARRWMRRTMATLRQPFIIDAAVALMAVQPFRILAWRIFFSRSSFPDVETAAGGRLKSTAPAFLGWPRE